MAPPLSRLPDGLRSVGMGLGQDGMPLLDVRANLPSPGDSSDNMAANMGPPQSSGNNIMSGGGHSQPNNVGTAALQAALVCFLQTAVLQTS